MSELIKFDGTNLDLISLKGRDLTWDVLEMRTRGLIGSVGIQGSMENGKLERIIIFYLEFTARQLPGQNFWLLFDKFDKADPKSRGYRYGNYPFDDFYFKLNDDGSLFLPEKQMTSGTAIIHRPGDHLDPTELITIDDFYGNSFINFAR